MSNTTKKSAVDHLLSMDRALRERVKELTCLYQIASLTGRTELSVEQILQEAAELLPPGWLMPERAVGRIELDGRWYTSREMPKLCCSMDADIVINGQRRGRVEVAYDRCPGADEGPFLEEEQNLIEAVARELRLLLERRQAARERDRLNEQIRHSNRLATLGQLSTGVAHELSEPLGAILGFAQLAQNAPDLPEQVQKDLHRIVAAALQARETVRKMMVFARKAPLKMQSVDLNALVMDGLDLLRARCARSGVELVEELDSSLPRLEADRGHLYQVIVNLAVNAVQAMPDGGRLTVATRADEEGVTLVVEDDGVGIPEGQKERIFDPFYTTKEVGEGTGLGLAVVDGIVCSHGGTIEVVSAEGEGTRISVFLLQGGPEHG